ALALVDVAELPAEEKLVQPRAAARGANEPFARRGGDGDAIVRADLLALEHVDERAEARGQRALLAPHRSRVVDHEQDVDRAPQRELDRAELRRIDTVGLAG